MVLFAGFVIAGFAGAMESTFHEWLSGDASIFPALLMSPTRYKKCKKKMVTMSKPITILV